MKPLQTLQERRYPSSHAKHKASLFALALGASLLASPVWAATCTVTSPNDAGLNTLRSCVAAAAAGDTVLLSVTTPITLTSGEIVINKAITIAGAGAASSVIDGNASGRIFRIPSTVTGVVTFKDMALKNGKADYGGAIRFQNAGGGLVGLVERVAFDDKTQMLAALSGPTVRSPSGERTSAATSQQL